MSGIVERVGHSEWAAPKKDGTIQFCGDYCVNELTVELGRLPVVGHVSSGAEEVERETFGEVIPEPPRHHDQSYEGCSKELFLVAQFGQGHRRPGEELYGMPD